MVEIELSKKKKKYETGRSDEGGKTGWLEEMNTRKHNDKDIWQ